MAQDDDFCTADPASTRAELEALGPIDIVVGIPSFNESDTIGFVARQCDLGLSEHFGGRRALILNVDNNSPDGTREAFLGIETATQKAYVSTPERVRGKGNNFYNLFQAARTVGACVVVAVDADLASITPVWMHDLVVPILDGGCDYVTPVYARNEYDGTITNHVCYPLIYGLLRADVRQPIGGDFALSTAVVRHLLEQEWSDTTRNYGVDVFATLNALLNGFRVCETVLGAKIHKPSAPKLGPMFTEVVTTLFSGLVTMRAHWGHRKGDLLTQRFGIYHPSDPQSLAIDYKSIKATVIEGYVESRDLLRGVLTLESFARVDVMIRERRMRMGARLWAHVIYDLLHAFERRDEAPEVIEALKPLYWMRVASFIRSTLDLSHTESEAQIQRQAREFRRQRSYLLSKFGSKSGEALDHAGEAT